MRQEAFGREMAKARAFITVGDRPDYWAGYWRGLRRRYHGENFGTDSEHELWMSLSDDDDETRKEEGRGYRDGYVIMLPGERRVNNEMEKDLERRKISAYRDPS